MTLGERYDFHVLYSQCYSGRVHLVHAHSGEQYIKREPNMLITRSYMRVVTGRALCSKRLAVSDQYEKQQSSLATLHQSFN